jgi:acyl transferase domain-containing protein/acyl carrier protein
MTDFADRIARLSPKRLALLALELQAQVESLRRAQDEPIAIVGMGCRFPGESVDPEAFWQFLERGGDAIAEIPRERWDIDAYYDADPEAPGKMYGRWGGFLNGIDQFDPSFFGMSAREAVTLDPQQRLLLEVTWETLESAALPAERLAGSRTGVFVGISSADYARLHVATGEPPDAHFGTGNAPAVAAGRLSYVFGLTGPCVALDTACSSSLVAVHFACQSLRQRECELALAGGVNVILAPDTNVFLSRAGMLARDGRCKTFSADADGYVRSEGCGMIALRRLSDAVTRGDRILAVIRGSAVNQDGRSSGLTAPSGPSQESVLREALSRAGVSAAEIDYLEAHGTGTALGDPIEVHAIGAVFGSPRRTGQPLRIGSVKTNLGHLESAAGIAGLIKIVLALQHEQLPPHLHFRAPNPNIAWDTLPVDVITSGGAWPRGGTRRLAGVSAFGFSGTNAHAIIEEAPAAPARQRRPERSVYLVAVSAKTASALRALARRHAAAFAAAGADAEVADLCFTANAGRSHFEHRLVASGASGGAIAEALAAYADGRPTANVISGRATATASVGLVCPAQARGALPTAAAALGDLQPAFRAALDECAAAAGTDLLQRPDSAVAQFTLQYALAMMWRSWGVKPVAVAGTASGEYVAAHLAGAFTLEDAVRLAAARDRSPDAAATVADAIAFAPLHTEAVASVTAMPATGSDLVSPGYWRRQATARRETAELAAAMRTAGCDTLLEIDANGNADEIWKALSEQLAHLYVTGAAIDWEAVDRGISPRRVSLPTYPFERQRYWIKAPQPASAVDRRAPAPVEAYEIAWRPAAAEAGRELSGTVGIFADRRGIADGLRQDLEARGARVALVHASHSYGRDASGYRIDAADRDDYQRVLEAIAADAGRCEQIVYLWASDLEECDPAAVRQAGCEAIAYLAHALSRRSTSAPRLVLATRRGEPIDQRPVGPAQSLVWGTGRVLALERPELRVRLVDLDAPSIDDEVRLLSAELRTNDAEDQVALRVGQRLGARLVRRSLERAAPVALRPDGTYLITGGSGALGLCVAGWMAERGARHLVLSSRRARARGAAGLAVDQAARQFADAVRQLEARGVEVTIESADVADYAAMSAVVERLRRGPHPLRGVVHAAGVTTAAAIVDLERADIESVCQPKVAGAWNLHCLTADLELDLFVLFSSIASVWGSATLGHYAAANHFLDALAHHRRSAGLPATVINWGPWSGGGMATPEALAALAAIGVQAIAPEDALSSLEAILAASRTATTIAAVDWDVFKGVFGARGRRPLLDDIGVRGTTESRAAAQVEALEQLRALAAGARATVVEQWVGDEVASVLGAAPGAVAADERFFDIGMDSILSVDLRRRLERRFGCALPPTIAFDYPTIARLSVFMLDTVSSSDPGAVAQPAASPLAASSVADLSDEEVERLFAEKLSTGNLT